MKRFFTGIALSAVMLLSSCSSGIVSGNPDIDKTFSAQAKIAVAGETVSGTLSRTAENCWTLSVDEPYALQGLTVTFNNGETTFSMLGFECKTDFSASAVSALKSAAEAYESAVNDADGFESGVFQSSNEYGAFSVALDEDGKPSVINAGGISVRLSEWTENTGNTEESGELILLE